MEPWCGHLARGRPVWRGRLGGPPSLPGRPSGTLKSSRLRQKEDWGLGK